MVACSKCGRPSNPDRRACIYCGGELTSNEGLAGGGPTSAAAAPSATAAPAATAARPARPAKAGARRKVRKKKGRRRPPRRSGGSRAPLVAGAIAVGLAAIGLFAVLGEEEEPPPQVRVRQTPVPIAGTPTPTPTATPEPPVLAPAADAWRRIELAGGLGTVEVPGGPLPSTLPGGNSLVLSGQSARGGGFVFQAVQAGVGRRAAEADRLIEGAIAAIAASVEGYVQSKREYEHAGRTGSEFWIAVRDSDDAIRCRAIVEGSDLLILTVRTRRDATDHEAVERFFGSLALTG